MIPSFFYSIQSQQTQEMIQRAWVGAYLELVVITDMELEPHTYKGKLGLVQPLAEIALLLAMAMAIDT